MPETGGDTGTMPVGIARDGKDARLHYAMSERGTMPPWDNKVGVLQNSYAQQGESRLAFCIATRPTAQRPTAAPEKSVAPEEVAPKEVAPKEVAPKEVAPTTRGAPGDALLSDLATLCCY